MKAYKIGEIYTCGISYNGLIYQVIEIKNGWVYYKQLFAISTGSGAFGIGSEICDKSVIWSSDKPVEDFVEYCLMVKNYIRERGLFPQDTMMSIAALWANYRMCVPYEKAAIKFIRSIKTARKMERQRKH